MGKVGGFKEWTRKGGIKRAVADRIQDFREIYEATPPELIRQQGGRCMDCGVPFCQQGCPLGNIIPDWNDLVFRDRWRDAYNVLSSTNNFPEFTGRLCPAPCEAACVLAINTDAVTIEEIEKQIIERAFAEGWVHANRCAPETGKSVAIVGSGPAGLAAAQQLRIAGHTVVVFEKSAQAGGLLRYGIPDFKLEKRIIDRRLELLREEGVEFRCGVTVGQDISWESLRAGYDAVLIATGAEQPRDLQIPGRELRGVLLAMDYLVAQNVAIASGGAVGSDVSAQGKRVVILGGGDTGSDCLGTAIRQGAAKVTQIELMPAPPSSRAAKNPWPEWPMVFRTSTSHDEGCEREFALRTVEITGADGAITGLRARRVAVTDGRLEDVDGSEHTIECDLLILALGFVGVTRKLAPPDSLFNGSRDTFVADTSFRTNLPKSYAAGDCYRGASLIVWAISDGREAARAIDAELSSRPSRLPTRGIDAPW